MVAGVRKDIPNVEAALPAGTSSEAVEEYFKKLGTTCGFDQPSRRYYALIKERRGILVDLDIQFVIDIDNDGNVTKVTRSRIGTGP